VAPFTLITAPRFPCLLAEVRRAFLSFHHCSLWSVGEARRYTRDSKPPLRPPTSTISRSKTRVHISYATWRSTAKALDVLSSPPRRVFCTALRSLWCQSGFKRAPDYDRGTSYSEDSNRTSRFERADERTRTAFLLITSVQSVVAERWMGLQIPHKEAVLCSRDCPLLQGIACGLGSNRRCNWSISLCGCAPYSFEWESINTSCRRPSHYTYPPLGPHICGGRANTLLVYLRLSQRPSGLPALISQSALRLSITTSRWVSSSHRSRKTCSSSG
jgi:hypothetical protein